MISFYHREKIFFSLCKSIIGQQISVSAADSVLKDLNNYVMAR